jgi:flagellar hook-associated protein FlgK
MSDILGIASGAVSAYQRMLSTVSNNIANVSTDGYSRQTATLEANLPAKTGASYIGTGVMFSAVKRAYDEFADSNLRKSTSDLMGQEPMVTYTQRVIDIMGDKSIGLNSALDTFFGAALNLSADPASSVQRSAFLRAAEGLTSRFSELSGQLSLVGDETGQAIESDVGQLNSLANQLSLVNVQLSKEAEVKNQPAELLDRRDLLLRQMSEFAALKTKTLPSGVVSVSLGSSILQSVIVDGTTSRPIGIDTTNGKLNVVLDPYGDSQPVENINSGKLGGLSRFVKQVLDPAHDNLDSLAQVVVDQINTIQRNGVDGYGQIGQNLFAVNADAPHLAAGLNVALSDPLRIATGAQFRVTEGTQNIDNVRASVSFTPTDNPTLVSNPGLVNNGSVDAGVPVSITAEEGYKHVTDVAPGAVSPTFFLDGATGDQQLQIITADGRHIAGSSLNLANQLLLIDRKNNYPEGTQYSDQYLNQTDAKGFEGLSVFYGARAVVTSAQMYDANGNLLSGSTQPASMTSDRVLRPATSYTILANAYKINGVNWPANTLVVNNSDLDIPKKIAASIEGIATGVHAQGYNQVEFDSSKLQFGKTLKINGIQITNAEGETNLQGLLDRINLFTSQTQVEAKVGDRGQLVLQNTTSQGGQDLTVSSAIAGETTTLGVTDQTYTGLVRVTRALEDAKNSTLSIELGQNGSDAMLQPTGLKLATLSPVILLPHPATLEGGRVPLPVQTKLIEAGSLVLNKVALPKLELTGNEVDPVQTMADWINSAKAPGVTAVAYNQVQLDLKKIDFGKDLYINGAAISTAASRVSDVASLINKIQAANVGVRARVGEMGQLIVENTEAAQGKSLTISGASPAVGGVNALGLKSQVYTGMLRITRKISDPSNSDLQLGFGPNGKPSQLAALGLRTGAYIEGQVTDTLKVFVVGAGTSSSVAASYTGEPLDMSAKLRAQSLTIRFTAPNRYEILDAKTGVQLADRFYEANGQPVTVRYQGLSVSLTSNPKTGDTFSIDGNQNGLGDNQNMMAMVELAQKKVVGSKTLGDAYIDQVNSVGGYAQQAKITQDALKVVNDQAIASRDKVSGVNLDQEAADLIRFQQAYQAAAKAMQISSQLFDSIIQVR